uniref:Legume lectin domain-containing protein n=1 Tax=Oryza brachyantha TaxID=4533 RepID=J3LVG3_ORYBR
MTYAHPVQLYDQASGRTEVASFSTSLTFTISLINNVTCRGDGMAFFLDSYPSKVPPKSAGGNLGFASEETTTVDGRGQPRLRLRSCRRPSYDSA